MKLTKTITSKCNPKRVYACAGEEVEVISNDEVVCLVRKIGEVDGFPVLKIYLSEDDNEIIITPPIQQPIPDTTVISNKASVSKKAKPTKQQTLF